jgi:hypothetical protein
VFSGANFALLDSPRHMTPDTAPTLNFLQSDIGAAGIVVGVSARQVGDAITPNG